MSHITVISDFFVRPKSEVPESDKYFYLHTLALRELSIGYSQYGLLFTETSSWPSKSNLFDKLKDALSEVLVYLYPLAGRLVTQKYYDEHSCSIFVDCAKGPGARLIHASASGLTVADVMDTSKDVPLVVQSFFDLGERQVNHDGHTRALLSLQMTDLEDGLFIGCCINHSLADATSVTLFLNLLSKVFVKAQNATLPVLQPYSSPLSEVYPILKLPYLEADEFVTRFDEGNLRDRVFQFSSETMKSLKAKANAEANKNNPDVNLSSFKALCGQLWISITRARKLLPNEETTFIMAMNFRSRLNPPLPPNYFANFIAGITATVKVSELLTNGLGWATMMIHQKIEEVNDDKVIREKFLGSPTVVNFGSMSANTLIIGGSPWLDLYGADFGLGKPVAIRTGYTNRLNGKIIALPSQHGSGFVDVQISLHPESMNELLSDNEFLSYVSS